jgi:hypothetical protein
MPFAGVLAFSTAINDSGFVEGTKALVGAATKLALAITAAFAVAGVALVAFGKKAVELASDLQEVQNVVDTVFGSMSKDIDEFSKTALDKFGLSELSAKRYASTIGAMLKPTGLATDQLTEMAKTLTAATGGMASFFNRSAEIINQDIQSYFAGSSETMYKYGLIATVANMETFALSQGITKLWKDMTQAEQQTLRYNFLLQNLGYTFNDFSKTIDSNANQTRLLSERWNEFLTIVGGQLLISLTPVIKMLNNLLSSVINVTKQFIKFYSVVSGSEIKDSGMADTVSATQSTSDSIGSANDNQKKLNKSIEKGKKEAEGQLASFDKVNVISEKIASNADSGGDSGIGGGSGFALSKAPIDLSKVEEATVLSPVLEKLTDLFSKLEKIDISPLTDSLKPLLDIDWNPMLNGLVSITNGFLKLFESISNNILAPFMTYVFVPFITKISEVIIPKALILAGNAMKALAAALDLVSPAFETFYKVLGKVIDIGLDILAFLLDKISEALVDLTKELQVLNDSGELDDFFKILGLILGVLASLTLLPLLSLIVSLGLMFLGLVLAIKYIIQLEKDSGFIKTIGEASSKALKALSELYQKAVKDYNNYFKENKFKEVNLDTLLKISFDMMKWIDENIFDPLWTYFTSEDFQKWFRKQVDKMIDVTFDVVKWLDDKIFSPLWSYVTKDEDFKKWFNEKVSKIFDITVDIAKWLLIKIIEKIWEYKVAKDKEFGKWFMDVVISTMWTPVVDMGKWIKEKIIDPIWDYTIEKSRTFSKWITQNIVNPFINTTIDVGNWIKVNIIDKIWGYVVEKGKSFSDWVALNIVTPMLNTSIDIGKWIKDKIIDPIWNYQIEEGKTFGDWIEENIIKPFKESGLEGVWKTIVNKLHVIFATFVNEQITGFESLVNAFVRGVNTMIAAANKLKFNIPDWVPNIGGKSFGFNLSPINTIKLDRISVPKLATGAVIPPNSEFMAILGDQKSGVNIETPLATMIQAFETALSNKGTTDINVNFTGTMAQLIRALKPEIEKEDRRVGRRKVSIA